MNPALRLLRWGGPAAWLGVGLPLWLQRDQVKPGAFAGWLVAWLLFAAAFWAAAGRRRAAPATAGLPTAGATPAFAPAAVAGATTAFAAAATAGSAPAATTRSHTGLLLLALQAAAVMGLVLFLCDGFEGALLVLVAMQLALRLPRRAGLAWIVVQSLLLGGAITLHWSLRPALLLTPPYLGFQVLAFLAVEALAGEARANAELRATRELLAHASRAAERLRLARELHDGVGHRLVALSLNLERASHLHAAALAAPATPAGIASHPAGGSRPAAADPPTAGASLPAANANAGNANTGAADAIRLAQSLTRRLLTDIGEIVDALGRPAGLDLRRALAGLSEDIPRPRVHLDLPPDLAVDDPETAHLLLRCCQEIVTNAAKHAEAANLWLAVTQHDGGRLELHARDDGRGAAAVEPGRGLAGMRDRLEQAGGRLAVDTHPGQGFTLEALLPLPPALRRGTPA